MAFTLAIETSGKVGSVALTGDDQSPEEEQFPRGLKHAAEILPTIDRLCRARGWRAGELRGVYVSAGPGSFTGLRIGITLAKTLSFATGARVVAVPSMRVLAETAPAEASNVVVVLDAKRDQIFTARFKREANDWREVEPTHLDTIAAMLERSPRPVYLVGEGIPYHGKAVREAQGVVITPSDTWRGSASAVARLGAALAREGKFADPYRLEPVYVRKPEAEEKYEAAQGRT